MNRADKSGFANWWFTVDRVALFLMLGLIGIGLMLAFAASPAITGGPLTAGDFHYAARQFAFACNGSMRPEISSRSCTRWPTNFPRPRRNKRTSRSGYQSPCRIQRPS